MAPELGYASGILLQTGLWISHKLTTAEWNAGHLAASEFQSLSLLMSKNKL